MRSRAGELRIGRPLSGGGGSRVDRRGLAAQLR
jgi:hypothetical protein